MKKILSLLLVAILLCAALAFSGCKKNTRSTLCGVSIKDYAIVYSAEENDYNARAAEYIQSEIYSRCGAELPIVLDTDTPVSDYEILVGETSRALSNELTPTLDGVEFALMAKEGKIAMEGDAFVIAAAAYYFIDTYFPKNNYDAVVPSEPTIKTPIEKEAKNFILLIGDGMGVYQTKMPEMYEGECEYSDGENIFYGYMLPHIGFSRTNSLTGTTDSAAGGTALATGYKTENGCIGQLPDGTPLLSLPELALSMKMQAGVMSTESATGATPASFSAHANERGNSSEIMNSQSEFKHTKGGILDCGMNYYNKSGIKTTEKHITDTLNKLEDKDGFFLMYEEAYIDKHCHNNDLDNAYLAVMRFNQAIGRFMEYAFYHPDTMVIITADHETGALLPDFDNNLVFGTDDHTGADVPVFAWGKGSECFHDTFVENIQIPMTIAKFMGKDNFGDRTQFQPLN